MRSPVHYSMRSGDILLLAEVGVALSWLTILGSGRTRRCDLRVLGSRDLNLRTHMRFGDWTAGRKRVGASVADSLLSRSFPSPHWSTDAQPHHRHMVVS